MIDPLAWLSQFTVTRGLGDPAILPAELGRAHTGVDLAAAPGTSVPALRPGVVVRDDDDPRGLEGISVGLRTDEGALLTFAHLARNAVREGQRVDPATFIGEVGQTGAATGPHLHLEVRDPRDRILDPFAFFGAPPDDTPRPRNPFDPMQGAPVTGPNPFDPFRTPEVIQREGNPIVGSPLDIPGAIAAAADSLKQGSARLAVTAGVLGFAAVLAYQGVRKVAGV